MGLTEESGPHANPQVLAMLQRLDKTVVDDAVPWCSAFVSFIAWLLDLPRSTSLSARSWLPIGERVVLSNAVAGFDVAIFKRGTGVQPGPDVLAAPGHVAFFDHLDGPRVWCVGGNQGDAVSLEPFPTANLLGLRRLSPPGEHA